LADYKRVGRLALLTVSVTLSVSDCALPQRALPNEEPTPSRIDARRLATTAQSLNPRH